MVFLLPNPILIAAAVIPAAVLLVCVYRADKLEKEPTGLILSLLFLGIFATGFAALTERLGSRLLSGLPADSTAYRLLLFFGVVAVSEEGFKYLLLRWRTWRSPAFNCQFDGVVYAVSVSLGFALWENIEYVLLYGFGTAMLRAVTAIPGHACFGVFMGVWYGLAKRYDRPETPGRGRIYRALSFLMPVLLHGGYDFLATLGSNRSAALFGAYVLVMFLVSYRMVRKASRLDRPLYRS